MHKQLLSAPLQQALLLVWAVGLIQLVSSPLLTVVNSHWLLTALLGSLLTLLLAGRLRRPWLFALATLVGVGALLSAVYLIGLPVIYWASVVALYGLMLWLASWQLPARPPSRRLRALLGLDGGWPPPGGHAALEATLYRSAFALVLAACLLTLLALGIAQGTLPRGPFTLLPVGLVFFVLAAQRYRRRLEVHLAIALWLYLALSLYILISPLATRGLGWSDLLLAPLLGLLALAHLALVAWHLRAQDQPAALAASLFARPLIHWALLLAGLAATQALWLAGRSPSLAGWSGISGCVLASLVFVISAGRLRRAPLSAIGAALLVCALLWGYSAARYGVPPWGLMPAGSAGLDQWGLLALTTLGLALLGRWLLGHPGPQRLHARPLLTVAWLLLGWGLLGATLILLSSDQPSIGLALLWLLAGAALFPLLGARAGAPQARGIPLALLASTLALSLLGSAQAFAGHGWPLVAWAFALWLGGNLLLPPCNRHLGHWGVASAAWPWLGLALLLASPSIGQLVGLHWPITLALAGYLFLLTRNSPWPLHWIWVPLLAWGGVLWSGLPGLHTAPLGSADLLTLGWANLLLLLAPLWSSSGDALCRRLGLPPQPLERPLLVSALLLLLVWTMLLALWVLPLGLSRLGATQLLVPAASATLIALPLLALSYLHLLWRWRTPWMADLLTLGSALALLGLWAQLHSFALVLLLALWCLLLTGLERLPRGDDHWLADQLASSAARWLPGSGLLALAVLLLPTSEPLFQRLAALLLLALAGAFSGLHRGNRAWVWLALGLLLASAHGVWLLWTPLTRLPELLPWYALQGAVAGWLLGRLEGPDSAGAETDRSLSLTALWHQAAPWVSGLAGLEWLGHGLAFSGGLLAGAETSPSLLANLAYLTAGGILLWHCIRQARLGRGDGWVYLSAALVAAAVLYLRLLWLGHTPPGLYDTGAILTSGYALLLLGRLTGSHPVYRLLLLAPLLALFTVPLALGSAYASLTLLAIGVLYLLARPSAPSAIPLYLGLIFINAAIYLWVPAWSQRLGLLQIYLLPAGLSALLLLYLRRQSLSARLLQGARLAALAVLYSATALDAFVTNNPWEANIPAGLAYLTASGLSLWYCIRQARRSAGAGWVYLGAGLVAGTALYLRLLWVGPVPPGPWDTAAIMASAYSLFLLARVIPSQPLNRVIMLVPLLALLTVPFQLGSAHASLTLLTIGALYLITRPNSESSTPLYLGLLAINAAIYLWVPNWSQRFGLLQVYLVPAALSVLLLLHLHRNELKRGVLHGARLAALCALYAAATIDVFLVDNLWVFALALAVALGGIVAGIGLRTRAFLYAGVIFLVLNVLGQMLVLYPEQRLGKALLLIGLGALITGAMTWFNLKREQILQQIRVFRSDLIKWE